jgi:hypothetical protein
MISFLNLRYFQGHFLDSFIIAMLHNRVILWLFEHIPSCIPPPCNTWHGMRLRGQGGIDAEDSATGR